MRAARVQARTHAARALAAGPAAAVILLALATIVPFAAHAAEQQATDDAGRVVTFLQPPARAIALAPHITELVFAAGAGSRLVGLDAGSDFPPAALAIPSVGEGFQPNAERVATLAPDVILGWQAAPANRLVQVLGAGAPPIFAIDPHTLRALPKAVRDLGAIFGTVDVAEPGAAALDRRLDVLERTYAQRTPIRVFVAVSETPIYTLNRASIVDDALRLCGGVNVFAQLPTAAAQVSREALLASDIEVVVTGAAQGVDSAAKLQFWQRLGLPAARAERLIAIDADLLYRPGPRLVDATEALCRELDRVRTTLSR